jgi:tetratricopeptide (TPR) repeat protein
MVLRKLPVFEAGTYLYQIGEYEMAFDCFNNLLSDFTSRENYNNAAVCKMQMALNLFQPYEMPFCFPFELDYESRIANGSNRSGIPTENGEKRESYLSDAKKLLEESIRKDPNYSKAKINLAICYIMLDNIDMASGILKEIESDSAIEKKVLNAICTAKKNNFTLALKELSEIIPDSGRYGLVANNKALFKLASEKKLNLGDDELGYQLQNSEIFIPNSSIVINKPENNALFECYNSTGRIINTISDSIRVSKDVEIFILKANQNYDNILLIKNVSNNHSISLFFISNSNACNKAKPANTIFLSALVNKVITTRGLSHKSVFAKAE